MVVALHLNTFIRHAYSVRMANLPSVPFPAMGINLIRLDRPVLLQPTFFPFEIYSRTCGKLAFDIFWQGDTFSGTYKNRVYSGIRTLDIAATLDEAGKNLVVYVVNQSKNDHMEAVIELTSGQFTGKVGISIFNGTDIKAENTEEKPNQVGVKDYILDVSGKSFTLIFEPHSLTALICNVG